MITNTTSVGSTTGTTDRTAGSKTAVSPSDQSINKEAFLQLLVAQLRNQNPLDPADGIQFLTQLAQFTELEQTMAMRQDLDAIRDTLQNTASAAGTDSTAKN